MLTLGDVENALAVGGLLAAAGKPGILVSEVDGGFLLQNVGPRGAPVRFEEPQIAAIAKLFPKQAGLHLERLLARDTEVTRRATMLDERQKSAIYSDLRSLDPDRPMPPPGTVDVRDSEAIPRIYTGLDLTGLDLTGLDLPVPEKPTLVVWSSEFSVGENRLDEAMVLMDIDAADAAKIRAGEDPTTVLKGRPVGNVRVLYLDPNGVIHGKKRLTHHLKSLDSIKGALLDVVGRFQVTITGNIFLHAEDDFVEPPAVRLTDTTAATERPKSGGAPPGRPTQRFSLTAVLVPVFAPDGSLTGLDPGPDLVSERFISAMKAADRQRVRTGFAQLVKTLRTSLATILRNS